MIDEKKMLLTSEALDTFLQEFSFSGLLSLYAFYLSHTSQKGFSFENIEKNVDYLPKQYSLAILVTSQALGLIMKVTNSNLENPIVNITSYNNDLSIKIKPAVYKAAGYNDSRLDKNATDFAKNSWESRIKLLEDYFK